MSDPLNELLIIGPLVAKIQVANILDWVSPLFSYVTYRDGERDDLLYPRMRTEVWIDFSRWTSRRILRISLSRNAGRLSVVFCGREPDSTVES